MVEKSSPPFSVMDQYRSLPDPVTLERNVMWQKQALKGFAEGIPNDFWILSWGLFVRGLKLLRSLDVEKIENLNQAYEMFYNLARRLFGQEGS